MAYKSDTGLMGGSYGLGLTNQVYLFLISTKQFLFRVGWCRLAAGLGQPSWTPIIYLVSQDLLVISEPAAFHAQVASSLSPHSPQPSLD